MMRSNYELGLKNDLGRALVNFIQSKLEDGLELWKTH